jgi:hypothetical protein
LLVRFLPVRLSLVRFVALPVSASGFCVILSCFCVIFVSCFCVRSGFVRFVSISFVSVSFCFVCFALFCFEQVC